MKRNYRLRTILLIAILLVVGLSFVGLGSWIGKPMYDSHISLSEFRSISRVSSALEELGSIPLVIAGFLIWAMVNKRREPRKRRNPPGAPGT